MKSSFFPTFLRKELTLTLKNAESLISVIFFCLIVLLIFQFGLAPSRSPSFAHALIIITALFGSLLRLNQSFQSESEGKMLDALRLTPGAMNALFLAKVTALVAFSLTLTLLTWAMAVLFLNTSHGISLLLFMSVPALLGFLGFHCVGCLFSSLTMQHGRKDVILPVILYPLLIPVIIAMLRCVDFDAISGMPLGWNADWLKILISFDVIYGAASIMVFDKISEIK